MAIIRKIRSDSPFFGVLKKGDDLREINGNVVKDFLDYMFFSADMSDENGALSERPVSLTVIRKGRSLTFTETVFGGDLRLDFEDDLMDDQKVCHNKCVFCFIDQMPKNMRDTLYYKDDDFRLSLIYGNYITMTNLSDEDIDNSSPCISLEYFRTYHKSRASGEDDGQSAGRENKREFK